MTVVYIDVLFLLNFLIDYLLLLVSARLSGRPVRRGRLLLAALLGGLYAAAVFFPGLSLLSSLFCKALASVVMVAVAFPFESAAALIRSALCFFAVSLVLAGGMIFAAAAAGGASAVRSGVPYLDLSLKTLLVSAACCYVLLSVVFRGYGRRRSPDRTRARLTIRLMGKSVSVCALIDTGCEVTDPATGRPALICTPSALAPLFSAEAADIITRRAPADALAALAAHPPGLRFRLLPFHAISGPGLMLAFRPDAVFDEKGRRLDLLVAVSPRPIASENGCQAVIGPLSVARQEELHP